MSGRAWLAVLVSGLAGFGLALGVGACGDDDRGTVTIQDGTGTVGTGTTGTGTVGTETTGTGTVGTTTAPAPSRP